MTSRLIKQYEQTSRSHSNASSQDSFQKDELSSQQDSSQVKESAQEDRDFFQKHGMFFCGTCKNLMDPHRTKGEILEFRCKRCGLKQISFKNREEARSMMYSRSLHSSTRKTELENRLIFDKSMPIMEVECPECGYSKAVFTVVPEEGQRKIIVKLICARGAQEEVIKCDKKWDLEQETEIWEESLGGVLGVLGGGDSEQEEDGEEEKWE